MCSQPFLLWLSRKGVWGKPLFGLQRAVSPTNFCIDPENLGGLEGALGDFPRKLRSWRWSWLTDASKCAKMISGGIDLHLSRLFHQWTGETLSENVSAAHILPQYLSTGKSWTVQIFAFHFPTPHCSILSQPYQFSILFRDRIEDGPFHQLLVGAVQR